MAEAKDGGGGSPGRVQEVQQSAAMNRKDRRKTAKKEKRKQKRKELAAKKWEEEEALLNDPEEQRRIQLEEERENERLERERKEFEEREKMFLEALAAKRKAEEEEEERRKALEEESKQNKFGQEYENDDDEWEYVEDGPPEIIWQGNEIIVKKKKIKVKRKDADIHIRKEDSNRPTSNPLPPKSDAFADCTNGSVVSAQQLLENAAQQIPNFGTEQDKAHCPFHLKTGACRFGSRCSRVHFYPDKSCTLLIKNMYNGPGLSWEQDEGLEHTDEEVERCYEEFYEDVHTEFLKFGEIVNFKVCKNSSFHLRGNVYVHYKSLDSALLACQSINGRYFAGKKVQCEFVAVTKWKVAICGEYMKSRLKTCSRGTACNFIHCFHNPGGDYEWADWDKPPPKYWMKKMAALFGYSEECGYDNQMEQEGRNSSKMVTADPDRSHRRSRSRERDSSRSHHEEYDTWRSRHRERHTHGSRKAIDVLDEKNCEAGMISKHTRKRKNRRGDSDSDGGWSNKDRGGDRQYNDTRKNSKNQIEVLESEDCHTYNLHGSDSDGHRLYVERHRDGHHHHKRESSSHWKMAYGVPDDYESKDRTHGTGSTVYSSGKDRDRDAYLGRRKETLKHQKKVPRLPDDSGDEGDRNRRKESSKHQKEVPRSPYNSRDDRDRDRDGGSREEDRDRHRKHKRKRSRHSNEEFEFNDDRGNSVNKLKDKYYNKESDSERVELKRVKKQHQSTREIKPNDTDSRYYYGENVDKVGRHPKSGEKFSVKHRNSYGDDSSDERDSSDSACQSIQRSDSQNSGYYSDEDINERGRWGSNITGPEKHR